MEFFASLKRIFGTHFYSLSKLNVSRSELDRYKEIDPSIPGDKWGDSDAFSMGELTIYPKRLLGQGTYGSVYYGTINQGSDQPEMEVVVKITARSLKAPKSFKEEVYAESIMSVDPHCRHHAVCMYAAFKSKMGFYSHPGFNYLIVYEKMDGDLSNLFDILYQSALIPNYTDEDKMQIALYIGVHMSYDLTATHGAGLIHKDIKPGNFLYKVDEGNRLRIKLGDYGLACGDLDKLAPPMTNVWTRSFDSDRTEFLQCGITGTLWYMPREIVEIARQIKSQQLLVVPQLPLSAHRFADVYATALSFLNCLVYMRLFDEVASEPPHSVPVRKFLLSSGPFSSPRIVALCQKYSSLALLWEMLELLIIRTTLDSFASYDTPTEHLLYRFCAAAQELKVHPDTIADMIFTGMEVEKPAIESFTPPPRTITELQTDIEMVPTVEFFTEHEHGMV